MENKEYIVILGKWPSLINQWITPPDTFLNAGKVLAIQTLLVVILMCTQISSVQSLSHVYLFATPWTAESQASLTITNSRSPHKPISIESMLPSNHLILLSPSPTFNLSQHQGLFKRVSFSHQVAKVLECQLQHQSLQWILPSENITLCLPLKIANEVSELYYLQVKYDLSNHCS